MQAFLQLRFGLIKTWPTLIFITVKMRIEKVLRKNNQGKMLIN
jgi:hypothetical protein